MTSKFCMLWAVGAQRAASRIAWRSDSAGRRRGSNGTRSECRRRITSPMSANSLVPLTLLMPHPTCARWRLLAAGPPTPTDIARGLELLGATVSEAGCRRVGPNDSRRGSPGAAPHAVGRWVLGPPDSPLPGAQRERSLPAEPCVPQCHLYDRVTSVN